MASKSKSTKAAKAKATPAPRSGVEGSRSNPLPLSRFRRHIFHLGQTATKQTGKADALFVSSRGTIPTAIVVLSQATYDKLVGKAPAAAAAKG